MSVATDVPAKENYRPLSEVRKTLRVKWYRSPIDHERLRTLSIRTDRQGWMQAGGHVLLYLVLATLAAVLWFHQQWLAFGITLWCVGFVATFYKGTGAHELGHGTVFKTRFLNSAFLHFVCLISWWDPYDYAASHTYHHRYTTKYLQCLWRPDEDYCKHRRSVRHRQDPVSSRGHVRFTGARESSPWSPCAAFSVLLAT